jgi:TRAP transporter TAXI family solute receptor
MDGADIQHTRNNRIANSDKRAGSGYRALTGAALVLIVASIIGGWFYLNQEPTQQTITIGAGPYRSDSHELILEVADVVARHSDWLSVKTISTRDSSKNISLLNSGKVDAATIRSDTPVAANVRLVGNLFPDYFQLLTRDTSRIFRIRDLLGKKVAIPRFGTDEFRSFWVIADHYDLPINKIQWISMEFPEASKKLLSGDVDAIFTVRSLRDRLLLNLFEDSELKNEQISFLSIDQSEAIALKRPFLATGTVPIGAFSGKRPTPARNTITPTVDRYLVTRETMSPEIVRELTRILFEHRLDLTIRFALASAIKQPDFETGTGIALHDGAEQYFQRNEPSFIQENAEPLALLVTVIAMLGSSMFALRTSFTSGQKNRMDSYNYVLLDIAEKAHMTNDHAVLLDLKSQLFQNLEEVVVALDTDQVTEKGFQSFSLLWETVSDVVKERLADVKV